jgi:site-specific DNA-methyltransferase (adenine-specific)
MMSSACESWRTPPEVLDLVRQLAPIALDPCGCNGDVVGAAVSWRLQRDGDSLAKDWSLDPLPMSAGLIYCNPPYGRKIGPFIEKCRETWEVGGRQVVALVPARTDAKWFQDAHPTTVTLFRGRLRFVGAPSSAPFPSALLFWGWQRRRWLDVFGPHGITFFVEQGALALETETETKPA